MRALVVDDETLARQLMIEHLGKIPNLEVVGQASNGFEAVKLAEDAGVRRLFLFHHAPERTDAELARIADELRDDLARRGSHLILDVAEEGEDLFVQEPAK